MLEGEVLCDAQLADDRGVPVLRDPPEPRGDDLRRARPGEIEAADFDPPGGRAAHAAEDVDELALPVARHARDAEDLAAGDLERDVVHRGHRQPLDPQGDLPRVRGRWSLHADRRPPDHQ
jgi:hypothetical protein